MPNEQVIADNHALIDRNRELECELAALKAKLGAVGRIADELNAEAMAMLDGCGESPIPPTTAGLCAKNYHTSCAIKDALR